MHERRRHRLDRTDHQRAAESNRRDRGPSERRISDALEVVADHDVPGTPPVATLEILRAIHESERETDTRRVLDISITRGDPMHGAKRTDDHVGRYEVSLPISEVDSDAVDADTCPECGGDRAIYTYRATHYIAGHESLFCPDCGAELYGEEWG